jgi:hypothetical protein
VLEAYVRNGFMASLNTAGREVGEKKQQLSLKHHRSSRTGKQAQYVVDAVLHYISGGEAARDELRPALLDEMHIEAVVDHILRDRDDSGTGAPAVSVPVGKVKDSSHNKPRHNDGIIFDDAVEAAVQ